MPLTSEERSTWPLCSAKKRNGELCRAFAGQGTDHPGIGRCKFHLGNTKNHRQQAVVIEAQRRVVQFGEPYGLEPVEALIWMVQLSAGHVRYLAEELSSMDEEERETLSAQIATRLWNEERDRLARISKAALDSGVQERAIVLAERAGAAIADVLRAIFDDPELALNSKQRAALGPLLQRHLEAAERQPSIALPAA
jgi:hypothetical protein